jgi:hypothetical protein
MEEDSRVHSDIGFGMHSEAQIEGGNIFARHHTDSGSALKIMLTVK